MIEEIYEAFDEAQAIIVYKNGEEMSFSPSDNYYGDILALWNEALINCHPMPAFGVSLNAQTEQEKSSGLWLEFVYSECRECYEMPFEKLLISVKKDTYGFNIIRYTREYGYYGRCYYIDLNGNNLNKVYEYLLNISR